MFLDLTVCGPAGNRDVRLEAPDDACVRDVRALLATTAGQAPDSDLFVRGRRVSDDQTLPVAGLRTGAIVAVSAEQSAPPLSSYALQVSAGPAAGRQHALRLGRVELGRDPACEVSLPDERVSRRHATLDITPAGVLVRDHGSTNGSTVDDLPVPVTGTPLAPGAVLRLGDSLLSVRAPAVGEATVQPDGAGLAVHRRVRTGRAAPPPVIALPSPPQRDRPRPLQWIAAALPAAAAGGLAWLTDSPVLLLFAALTPVLLIATAAGDRWELRRARRVARRRFTVDRRAADQQLSAALADETAQRRGEQPDPATLALIAAVPGADLWARRPEDDAFLQVRVGCGPQPSRVQVQAGDAPRPGGVLASAPVTVDLRGGVGVAGAGALVDALARWCVLQLAVHHSPDELHIVVATTRPVWAWARWLPHVRLAVTHDERDQALADLEIEIARRERLRAAGEPAGDAAIVVVLDAPAPAAAAALVARGREVGVDALWSAATADELPQVGAVVVVAGGAATLSRPGTTDPQGTEGGPTSRCPAVDGIAATWAESVARHLAPLRDADASRPRVASLPATVTLTGPLGLGGADVTDVLAGWAGDDGRADTVLGLDAEGPVTLDLDRDGPHLLVAGTTGAGKSELLRTLVLGLCLRHPPDALTVLLVDYKGGAAFAECAVLPHCVGLVTDLDAHLTRRALQSLDAEIRRRETLLRGAGASDVAGYRATNGGVPLARLVIVVDEFASLAEELPEFVPGLVGIAQRGRSLGLHLVLATQRPGSAVSAEIRANTAARIALRVTEAADSLDVVGSDAAAGFTPSVPGRAVLRTGSGTRIFQTAQPVRTPTPPTSARVSPLDRWGRLPDEVRARSDGLGALADTAAQAAELCGRPTPASPWREPLPDVVHASALPADRPGVPFALADLPVRQDYETLTLSLQPASSLLVVGGARSGRTTMLTTLARSASSRHRPAELEIHLVDPVGDLAAALDGLPHLSSVLGPDDADLAATLFDRLCRARPGRLHLLLVDGWDRLGTALGDDAAAADDLLLALLRTTGQVTPVLTGDRGLLTPRLSAAFAHRLLLRLSDPADAGLWGLRADRLPSTPAPGRGVRVPDGVEFQVALAPAAGDPRTEPADTARADAAGPRPPDALVVRPLPPRLTLSDVPHANGALRIGLGGDDGRTVTFEPTAGSRRWLVSGPPRAGRSTALRTILAEAVSHRHRVVVAADARSPLAAAGRTLAAPVLDPGVPSDHVDDALAADVPTLLLVDDADAFLDTAAGDALLAAVRDHRRPLSVVVSGRPDDLALAYRGLAAEVRRSRSGLALRPGPVDGELFGCRLPRASPADPPGRGWLVADPAWSIGGRPAPPVARVQLATSEAQSPATQPMWGYR